MTAMIEQIGKGFDKDGKFPENLASSQWISGFYALKTPTFVLNPFNLRPFVFRLCGNDDPYVCAILIK
jgi:hypothetical protein